MAVVSLDNQASQEREARKVKPVFQGYLCPVPQDVKGLLVLRVHQVFLDLQAFPQQYKTASLENPGVPVCREREVTQERQARKVIRETLV